MNTKIKTFKTEDFSPEGLKKIENEINAFTRSHNTLDIKVTSCCNSFGWLLVYCVIYEEENNDDITHISHNGCVTCKFSKYNHYTNAYVCNNEHSEKYGTTISCNEKCDKYEKC